MSGLMESVNLRTQLVGKNRLELLLFNLAGKQQYGINVFKVREVIHCPELTVLPMCHHVVRGITNVRGKTLTIIDLGMAIKVSHTPTELENSYIIITEYNRSVQGFLVSSVERIVNLNWESVRLPPAGTSGTSYLTAVTEVDKSLVEIIDVEQVLAEVMPRDDSLNEETAKKLIEQSEREELKKKVLIVDDSGVARKQISRCMEKIGFEVDTEDNGACALQLLKDILAQGRKISDVYNLIISDIEMPEMDGYTLTTEIRADARMCDICIILHTSMSGVFNQAMVDKVGANDFIAKFAPEVLAQAVLKHLTEDGDN